MRKPLIDTHSTGFAAGVMFVIAVVTYIVLTTNASKDFSYAAGRDKYDAGNYSSTVTEFRADVKDHPEHSLGHYYLACSLVKIKQPLAAQQEFERAYQVELRASNPDLTFAAKCLSKSKDCGRD